MCRPRSRPASSSPAADRDGADLVQTLLRSTDATALVVTHNVALARRMDVLWLVEHGKVVEAGGPELLLAGQGPTARHFRPRTVA
jgi:ABC-type multidrug transport system fused ATPase/permease subunit